MARPLRPPAAGLLALLALLATAALGLRSPAPAAAAPLRIMLVGDGITQGTTGDVTWRYRLWRHLERTAPGGVRFVGSRATLHDPRTRRDDSTLYARPAFDRDHEAAAGASLKATRRTIARAVRAERPDVLLVLLGTMDLAFGSTPREAIADLRALVANARRARPGLDVVAGQVAAGWSAGTGTYTLLRRASSFNTRLSALGRRMDRPRERFTAAWTAFGFDARTDTWNGSLPNTRGEVKIAAAFANALAAQWIGGPYRRRARSLRWPVRGPRPVLEPDPAAGGLRISWDGATPGASAYRVLVRAQGTSRRAYTRLPFPLARPWTYPDAVPGVRYDVRLVPVKGTMAGRAGPVASAAADGPLVPRLGGA